VRVIKEKYRESPEFTLFSDFRSAEHTNLFKHREILEEISKGRQPQSKSLKYLQEDCELSFEESKAIFNAFKRSRPRIPANKKVGLEKPPGKSFEDRVWRLFYNMGAQYLNTNARDFQFDLNDYQDLLPSKAQIDVLGVFQDKFLLIAECTSSRNIQNGRYLESKINKIKSYKSSVKKRIKKIFSNQGLIPIWILATENYKWSSVDKSQLLKNDLIILSDIELKYLEDCFTTSESSFFVFNQFLGFFKGNSKYYEDIKVTALKTNPGFEKPSTEVFTFSIKPLEMMRICSVSHRKAKNIYEADGLRKGHYQRILEKGRLKSIGQYLDEEQSSFKNNLLVSFRGKNSNITFNKGRKGQGRGGELIIKACPGSFHIIDGQHRLYAYSAIKNSKLAENHELIVTAFTNLTEAEEAQLFIDVNSKQKAVKKDLIREVRELKGFASKGKERIENMATKITATLREVKRSPFNVPKSIRDTEPVREAKLLTPLAMQNAIIETSLIHKRFDFKKGFCASNEEEEEENYFQTIKNCEDILIKLFEGVKEATKKDWVSKTGYLNTDGGPVYNAFIGALILTLARFMEHASFNHTGHSSFNLNKINPYLEHLFSSLKNMNTDQRALFYGDRSKFRTETGRRYVRALLIKEFFEEKFPGILQEDDRTYLKRTKDNKIALEKYNELLGSKEELANRVKKYEEGIKKKVDSSSSISKNDQAQRYEKYFRGVIHLYLEKTKGKDYWDTLVKSQGSAESRSVLKKVRSSEDETLQNKDLDPYRYKMSYCNFPEFIDLLKTLKNDSTAEEQEEVDQLFALEDFEKHSLGRKTPKDKLFGWMEFMNVLRRFNDSGHSGLDIDIDPSNTNKAAEKFEYYNDCLKEKMKLIKKLDLS
jgi:DGQHR domain-containing protein